jgi:hypothetical protein
MNGVAIPVTGIRTDRVRIAPVPDWVAHEPYSAPDAPDPAFIHGGLCVLLNDTQVDLCGPVRGWHVRNAERVVSTLGAERAAQFSVSFNPSFEDLHIHYIRVIRNGIAVDHAQPENFEILRRERRLERLVLDGRLTVTLITPDVRVGDLIETSYTTYGLNPALGGLHTAWIGFEWGTPLLDTRHRLRHPATRTIAAKPFLSPPPETRSEADGIVTRQWRAFQRPAAEPLDLAPPWMPAGAEVQFSEAQSWGQVAALFAPLYHEADEALPADLAAEIEVLGARFQAPKARAVEALRFVQSHIRYLAVSIGEGGYQPRPLAQIWATRYGDCKDVSRLLTALARRLGLEAVPALVNTQAGEGLSETLPSPTAFNHCIVRMQVDGAPFWMDATGAAQGGDLDHLHQPYFGFALPLTGPWAGLERMKQPQLELLVAVEEEVELSASISDPAIYRWRTTYYGPKADQARDEMRNEGDTGVSRRYLRQLRDLWPHAEPLSAIKFEDDFTRNVFTVEEAYRLPLAWRQRDGDAIEFSTKDFFLPGELYRAQFPARAAAIHLARPRKITRSLRLKTRFKTQPSSWRRKVEGPAFSLENTLSPINAREVLLSQSLVVFQDTMPGQDAALYGEITEELGRTDLVLVMRAKGDKVVSTGRSGFSAWLGEIAFRVLIAAATFGLIWFAAMALEKWGQ